MNDDAVLIVYLLRLLVFFALPFPSSSRISPVPLLIAYAMLRSAVPHVFLTRSIIDLRISSSYTTPSHAYVSVSVSVFSPLFSSPLSSSLLFSSHLISSRPVSSCLALFFPIRVFCSRSVADQVCVNNQEICALVYEGGLTGINRPDGI